MPKWIETQSRKTFLECLPPGWTADLTFEASKTKDAGDLRSVELFDEDGEPRLRLVGDQYGARVKMFMPAPPTMVEKFNLTGTLGVGAAAINVDETFDDHAAALDRQNALESTYQATGALKIEKTEEPDDDNGGG